MPEIDFVASTKVPRGLRPDLRRALSALMIELGYGDHALTLVFVGDEEIRALKKQHWGEDTATDVLSFPTFEPGDPFVPPHLGDIVISLDTAARQAVEHGHSLQTEVRILAAHSLWHLLGHDHTDETEWQGFHRVQALIRSL
ncbi:MAG: rRNA maturation RNase YbeY [Meiothermus sp.]